MLPEPTSLDDLEIIGYADALPADALPEIVTPVFRCKKDHDRILLPPFRLDANFVYGGAWDGVSRWQSLIKTGNMTELNQSIPAKSDHQLWIDEDNQPRYERRSTAHKNLETIASERVVEAQKALAQDNLAAAEQLATTAFNADDRNIDALVVKGAIRKLQGKPRHVAFFASLAHGIAPDHFTTLVESLLEAQVLTRMSPVSNVCATRRENAERELFPATAAA